MEIDRMNYYFTGILITMFVLLALFGGPAQWLINLSITFLEN